MGRKHQRQSLIGAAAVLSLCGLEPLPVHAVGFTRFVMQQEFIHDRGAPRVRLDDFLDTTFHVNGKQWNAALTVGNYATGLRAGGFLTDRRGSTYSTALNRRTQGFLNDTSLAFETGQKFERFVGLGGVRFMWPDRPEAANLYVIPTLGAELYYDDWSFVSLGLALDPRRGSGTTLRILNRLGAAHAHLDVALAPRTDGVVNWSLAARYRFAFVGYASERDFDFSGLDRSVWSAGFHYDFTTAP